MPSLEISERFAVSVLAYLEGLIICGCARNEGSSSGGAVRRTMVEWVSGRKTVFLVSGEEASG